MDDMNISNHIAIASEAFLQVVMLLARILMASVAVAFVVTTIGVICLCLDEGRKRLPKTSGASEPARASRKATGFPVNLNAGAQRQAMSLSARHHRA